MVVLHPRISNKIIDINILIVVQTLILLLINFTPFLSVFFFIFFISICRSRFLYKIVTIYSLQLCTFTLSLSQLSLYLLDSLHVSATKNRNYLLKTFYFIRPLNYYDRYLFFYYKIIFMDD